MIYRDCYRRYNPRLVCHWENARDITKLNVSRFLAEFIARARVIENSIA